MHIRGLILVLTSAWVSHVQAAELNVLSFGGANKAAQEIAFYQPFHNSSGIVVNGGDYNGDYYREIVQAKKPTKQWDVVELSSPELTRACSEGRLTRLDWSRIGMPADFVNGSVTDCGVGIFSWSAVLAYNADQVARVPKNWRDFWDVKGIPGKRGMHQSARYTLEFALMADGVPPADVYQVLATPAGVDRAFKKLSQLKPHIVWWESPAQPANMLAYDQVVMSVAYNGRITAAQKDWPKLRVMWNDNIYNLNYWAIPKGADTDNATRFVVFASQPENQKNYASYIDYGPTRLSALQLLPAETAVRMPTAPANLAHATPIDSAFWVKHGQALEMRFNAWLSH
ncbi:ABC transporter substrate-binding protein [Craterilacuibacter sinensis]|uniref:Extracellular solute-binding protein n=1 Tax=Craterilacuibacter sinensis TaxID=2686017 RepID=A0A845BQL0_9NEIS|nr:ABC transporter substrate-binding protein [Craterilacuibacter sinensis]MXR37448.1 extracellular solute-binding protein [Craterilacuibacter sinensis]